MKGTTIIIPSYEPDEKLIKTIEGLEEAGFQDIIIVNDGSSPENLKFFPDETEHPSCTILTHKENKGKGRALKTAFEYILKNRPDVKGVVTADGDGQHAPKDILACANKMYETGGVVLGCRDFSGEDVPARSKFGNRFTTVVLKLFCGLSISDTQTGLRAFPVEFLDKLIEVKGERFEYETNMLICFKQKHIPFSEEKIETVYIEENKTSHFRPIVDSLRIYRFILGYCMSSCVSAIIDEGLFFILSLFVNFGLFTNLFNVAAARLVSSLTNFTINKTRVFANGETVGRALIKYYMLAVPQMLVSVGLLYLLTWLVGLVGIPTGAVTTTIVKIIVDVFLFMISFRIQQNWVFVSSKRKHKSEKPKKKLTKKTIIGRILLCFVSLILALVLTVVAFCYVAANGASETFRNKLVLSAKQASATKWIPELFLDDDLVQKIVEDSKKVVIETVDIEEVEDQFKIDWDKAIDGMVYYDIKGPTYKAYMLIVKDPSRLQVGVASDNFATSTGGARFYEIAEKYNAVALINAGEFADYGGVGNGARPMGITYSGGRLVHNDGLTNRTYIGFNKENQLIVKEGMTLQEAESLGIRDMVAFQNNNVLIERDGDSIKVHYKEWDSGTAQRTAIGQRADGSVILLVTDGRTASSLGATPADVTGVMLEYGAVSAAMLDGGSSAMMYYKDYYNKYDVDTSKLDEYQKMGLVSKYKAFTAPRRMPTYFIVKGE